MAEYKDIYYADSSSEMSIFDIGLAEAVSIGDKLEKTKLDSVVAVDNSAARDALFPTPVQGDAVWNKYAEYEERWYDAYHSKKNPGGREKAGWYATTSKITPIIPPAAVITGAGSSSSINELGEISFSACTSLRVDNILYYFGARFKSFKVVLNITSTSGTLSYPVWGLTTGGLALPSVTYNAVYQGVSAGASAGAVWSHAFLAGPTNFPANTSSCFMELNLEPQIYTFPSSSTQCISYTSQSSAFTSTSNTSFHMLSGSVYTTSFADGFYLATAAGAMAMTGKIKFYGIL